MIRLIFLLPFFLLSKTIMAQLSIGYYPIQSEISFSTNSDRLIWGDLRIATNTFFGNITTEPILMANLKRNEKVNFYGGVGMNFNFLNAASNISIINGYSLHIGSRIKPLKKLSNLQIIFEVSPYMNSEFDGGLLRTRLGLAYQFGKKRKHISG
ncbi:MAG: hypothetical protein AB8B74_06285 [Crocinitomicaceae bacterium]